MNSGGLAEFIEHGRVGLLCEPGDETAFVNSINELLSSAEENSKMGEYARRFALENLNFQNFVDKWEELYAAMLSVDELPNKLLVEN